MGASFRAVICDLQRMQQAYGVHCGLIGVFPRNRKRQQLNQRAFATAGTFDEFVLKAQQHFLGLENRRHARVDVSIDELYTRFSNANTGFGPFLTLIQRLESCGFDKEALNSMRTEFSSRIATGSSEAEFSRLLRCLAAGAREYTAGVDPALEMRDFDEEDGDVLGDISFLFDSEDDESVNDEAENMVREDDGVVGEEENPEEEGEEKGEEEGEVDSMNESFSSFGLGMGDDGVEDDGARADSEEGADSGDNLMQDELQDFSVEEEEGMDEESPFSFAGVHEAGFETSF